MRNLRILALVGIFVAVTLFQGYVPESFQQVKAINTDDSCDWPMRDRTPDKNIIVPVECAPGLGQLESVWEEKLEYRLQYFAVAGDRIFLVATSFTSKVGFVQCRYLHNGGLLWKNNISQSYFSDFFVFKGLLIFYISNDIVFCLDSSTGEIAWKRKLSSGSARMTYFKDSVILCTEDEGIEALDPFSGDTLWIIPVKDKIRSIDILIYDDSLYGIAYSDWKTDKSYLFKVDLLTKTVEIIFEMTGQELGNLIVSDDSYCFTGYFGKIYCLDSKQKTIRWSMETNGYNGISTMIINNQQLYFCEQGSFDLPDTYGSSAMCVDIMTGKIIWLNDHDIDYFSQMFMYGNLVMYGTRYKGLMVANAITGQIINKTVDEKSSLYPFAISRKMVFVSKWDSNGNSLVCMREKVCR